MIVADKETALVLQVQLGLETVGIDFADNLLFKLLEVNNPSLTFQILHVVIGEIENG